MIDIGIKEVPGQLPTVITGELPAHRTDLLSVPVTITLVIDDLQPVIALDESGYSGQRFHLELRKKHFRKWHQFIQNIAPFWPGNATQLEAHYLPGGGPDPILTQEIHAYAGPMQMTKRFIPEPGDCHLIAQASGGHIFLTQEDQEVWKDELGYTLILSKGILDITKTLRAKHEEEFLMHVGNYLITSQL